MPAAFRDFRGSIIGQPIVPGVQSSFTTLDRIIFISPGIVIVRELGQLGCISTRALARHRWFFFGDQRLV